MLKILGLISKSWALKRPKKCTCEHVHSVPISLLKNIKYQATDLSGWFLETNTFFLLKYTVPLYPEMNVCVTNTRCYISYCLGVFLLFYKF